MATSAIASKMSGKDIIASTTRMMGVSRRRKNPAIKPNSAPSTIAPMAVRAAIVSE